MPFVDIKSLAASTHEQDVFDRQQLQIPTTDSSTITVVTDTKICDKVLAAFKPDVVWLDTCANKTVRHQGRECLRGSLPDGRPRESGHLPRIEQAIRGSVVVLEVAQLGAAQQCPAVRRGVLALGCLWSCVRR